MTCICAFYEKGQATLTHLGNGLLLRLVTKQQDLGARRSRGVAAIDSPRLLTPDSQHTLSELPKGETKQWRCHSLPTNTNPS